jgi:hypothetical protein
MPGFHATRPGNWLLVAAVLVVLAWQLQFAWRVLRSDPGYFSAQREVVFWGAEGRMPTTEQVARVARTIDGSVAAWPANGDYLALQARVRLWEALLATDRSSANRQLDAAIDSMEQSFLHRPAHPQSWLQYAEYLAARRNDNVALREAVTKVEQLAPGDEALLATARALGDR